DRARGGQGARKDHGAENREAAVRDEGALRAVAPGAACRLFGHTAATAAEERQRRPPVDAARGNADRQEGDRAVVGLERAAARIIGVMPPPGCARACASRIAVARSFSDI